MVGLSQFILLAPKRAPLAQVVDEAGDIASRTKAWLRLAKARGEMGHTWHAEQCLAKVKAAGNKAGAGTTSRRAAREAAAYLKLLRERNKKTKRDFGKIFDGCWSDCCTMLIGFCKVCGLLFDTVG